MRYIFLTFLALILFNNYLFMNIINMGGSHALPTLAVVLLLLIVLVGLRVIVSRNIFIRKSFIALIFFFLYLTFKICVDIGDITVLKDYTIGSTGGILLFYFIGVLINIVFDRVSSLTATSGRYFALALFLSGIYLLSSAYFVYKAYGEFSEQLRDDIFLISGPETGLYQRPGAFLTISSLLLSFTYINLLLNAHKRNFLYKTFLFIYVCIFIVVLLSSMLFAQMIGSNSAFICIGCLLVVSLIFSIFILFPKVECMLRSNVIRFKDIISRRVLKKFVFSALIGLIVFIGILILVMKSFDIEPEKLRIMNYGNTEIGAMDSRLELLSNFITHLDYSPITPFVGNMRVDELTTGKGTYVHSFLASILTHLGIIGVIMILLFILFSLEELFDKSSGLYKNGMKIYKALLFFIFFIITIGATFFTWVPIWFLMGLFFLPISLYINNKRFI